MLVGTRIGAYEVIAKLGEGGMGQVYRATDTTLKRQVAIKILPAALATDPDRLARFQREAEVLASLSHPNIAAVHGLEDTGGSKALVMELVEGEDLSQRITRGAIPLDEALPIAKQIAEALEAAHEQGIIHRDLKPANVKVRPDGAVKVLDFGLAKLAQPGDANRTAGSGHELAQSPTITTPAMTQMGLILGTAAYMAPEQARGRLVDKRADIWAFGALLFEMLTGRRAFEGDDLSITLATVMMKDPDWGSMPPAIPSGLQRLVRRCLVKDPRQRIRDMGDVRLALEGVLDAEPDSAAVGQPGPAATAAPQAQRSSLLRRVATLAAVAVVASGVAGTIVWLAARPLPPRVSRTTITMSGPSAMTISGASRDVAITPDGSRVVYVGNNSTQIYVRALDSLEPVAVASGVPARSPFVSPDGQWVGFFDGGLLLKKVAISGGPPITLARLDGAVGRGGAWLVDDTIVFASANPVNGLMSVPAGGGEPKVLTTPDGSRVESDHLFPEALPGSRAVLFTITAQTGGPDAAAVAVYDLDTNTQTIVVRGGSHAQFVPAPAGPLGRRGRAGHLVYVASGTLRAVPFDPDRLAVLGPAVPVVPRMFAASTGAGVYAVSTNGTLVYADAPLGSLIGLNRLLAWVDRQGKEEPIAAPPRAYQQARASPDGSRLALYVFDQEQDIWLWDLRRSTMTRLTFDPASDQYPVWTRDGRRIAFASQRDGAFNVWWQAADGSGSVERLTEGTQTKAPGEFAPDGTLLFHEVMPSGLRDLMSLSMEGSKKVSALLQTRFDERDPVISPDGRWLAYGADNTGRSEVYVRPYPDAAAGQWQISNSGAKTPLWSRDGKELFYFAADGALMAVPVESTSTAWNAGPPVRLLAPLYDQGIAAAGRTYDISADGKRFLMIKAPEAAAASRTELVVVLHFDEELKRVAGVK